MTVTDINILITGGSGQVGIELKRFAWPAGTHVFAPDRAALDIADKASVAKIFSDRRWDAVINAAAYTAVDKAERDVAEAWRINALGPALLAAATALSGTPLVHVSTDYVFAGNIDRPFVENDPIGPLGVYGASKEGGEQAVRTANPRHAIVRTSWVVSAHGGNFVKTMLRLGAERSEVSVVNDQFGCPTMAPDLASGLAEVALRLVGDPLAPGGTYHLVNGGETTWHGFAEEIFAQAGKRGRNAPATKAIKTADYPTAARRPANSRLSAAKIKADYGIRLRPWQQGLVPIIDELLPVRSSHEKVS